ncbi:MAG: ankyrin repeat domain-containing protein [Planctomycetes bacterium]|nr:ankyrin repeat domain-containing protein [Planctomycetota bacterium]
MSAMAGVLHLGLRRAHPARLGACVGCIALLGVGAYAVGAWAARTRHRAAYVEKDPLVATWRRARDATRKYRTIHEAVRARDHVAVAAFLIAQGEPNALDEVNQTPLHAAAFLGYDDIAATLIAAGADLKARGNGGQTPLHNAAIAYVPCTPIPHAGRLRVAALLIKRGADLNARNSQGWTPLHVAASADRPLGLQLSRLFLESGADVDARNKRGDTPLAVAEQNGCRETAKVLASYGGH